jgi:hypothetical protein
MRYRHATLLLGGLLLAGCSAAAPASPSAWAYGPPAPSAAAALVVDVYKSPTCGCCHEWEAYIRAQGYEVRSIPTDDMAAVKAERGVPEAAWSCHTAVVAGYVVEGHVPFEAIEALLASRPAIDGIALPAMPDGSPGMPGVKAAPFEILAIDEGATSPFGAY